MDLRPADLNEGNLQIEDFYEPNIFDTSFTSTDFNVPADLPELTQNQFNDSQFGTQPLDTNLDVLLDENPNGIQHYTNDGLEQLNLNYGLLPQQVGAYEPVREQNYLQDATNIPYLSDSSSVEYNTFGLSRSIIGNRSGSGKHFLHLNDDSGNGNEHLSLLSTSGSGQGEDLLSSQSSSEASLESTIPSLIPLSGEYEFSVVPEISNSKKGMFSKELNKLFCDRNVPVLFNFHFSKEKKADIRGLQVKAMLVYTDSADRSKPVNRCVGCTAREAEHDNIILTEVNRDTVYYHVLRCNHKKAYYTKCHGHTRHCVIVPLEKPQMGFMEESVVVGTTYEFMCLNTCDSIKSKLSLVFELLENSKNVAGRYVMELKVCRCPKRDHDIELKKSGNLTNDQNRKRSANANNRHEEIGTETENVSIATQKQIKREPGIGEGEEKVLINSGSGTNGQSNESEENSFSQSSQNTATNRISDSIPYYRGIVKDPNASQEKRLFAQSQLDALKLYIKNHDKHRKMNAVGTETEPGGAAAGLQPH